MTLIDDIGKLIGSSSGNEGLGKIIPNTDNAIKTVADSYNLTVKTTSDTISGFVDNTANIIYIELNNWFQLIDDIRENVSSLIALIAFLMACGLFIGIIMYGDKVFLALKYLPKIAENMQLVRL